MNRFRVAKEHGNPHASRIHLNAVVFENLLRFPDHFHFFTGVAVVLKGVDVWQHVKRDPFWIHFNFSFFPIEQLRRLLSELLNSFFSRATHRLIGRDIDALNTYRIANRLERHQHLYGRTVGVSNNAALCVTHNGVRVDLGYNERNIFVPSKMRRIVHNNTSGRRSLGCVLSRYCPPSAEQTDLYLGEIELGKIFNF